MIEPSPSSPAAQRPRRLRRSAVLRNMVAETIVPSTSLIQPHFILPTAEGHEEISSMPGIHRMGYDTVRGRVEADLELGIRTVLLFGLAEDRDKDAEGRCAAHANGAVQRAVEGLKKSFGQDLLVITDVCLCAYTDHGHCGILDDAGDVLNDPSLEPLTAAAVSHAQAGADMVAPSDMMDGRVGALRAGLDAAGFDATALLSYSVKYASAYYGPFRDAASSAPGKGDRRGYQMDPRNSREALRELALDVEEGADMVMVKPALAYLDVIRTVADASPLPLAVYNVSGEFSAVKAAAERGWLEESAVVRENLMAMRRAGADVIITYHAREALAGGWLETL